MESCMRKVNFSYGHRLTDEGSKCSTLHGHNAVVEIYVTGDSNDRARATFKDKVVDFSVIKERIGGWIDMHWDHTTILSSDDVKTIQLLSEVPHQKPLFILDSNPTAEAMARYLLNTVCPRELVDTGVECYKIVLWETANCCAEVTR